MINNRKDIDTIVDFFNSINVTGKVNSQDTFCGAGYDIEFYVQDNQTVNVSLGMFLMVDGQKWEVSYEEVSEFSRLIAEIISSATKSSRTEKTTTRSATVGEYYDKETKEIVQKDKIYKIEYTKENIDIMRKEEKIPTGSNIVCQEEEIKDNMKQKQKGFHQYLLVQGDSREYHSYNDKVESGYFETYIWERDIGLKYYKSGYGAEKNLVELQLSNK